jgi:membrane fusion protein (multidrug efflux system)
MQGIYQVGVVSPDGRASIRLVKIGPKVGSFWVINEGLNAGDKVIIEGLQKLRPDASGSCPVIAKPWTPPVAATAPAQKPGSSPAPKSSEAR